MDGVAIILLLHHITFLLFLLLIHLLCLHVYIHVHFDGFVFVMFGSLLGSYAFNSFVCVCVFLCVCLCVRALEHI